MQPKVVVANIISCYGITYIVHLDAIAVIYLLSQLQMVVR